MRIVFLTFFTLLSPFLTNAQQTVILNVGGMSIWIGMSEDQLNEGLLRMSLRRNEYGLITSIERSHCDAPLCPFNLFGTVSLRNGKVGYISKDWLLNETPKTQVAFAEALYGAFLSATGGEESTCRVNHANLKEPNIDEESVTVECPRGPVIRKVVVSHSTATLTGVNGPVISTSIQEILTTREWNEQR
jgi:hypothetical protein